jgi:hypothetical protein
MFLMLFAFNVSYSQNSIFVNTGTVLAPANDDANPGFTFGVGYEYKKDVGFRIGLNSDNPSIDGTTIAINSIKAEFVGGKTIYFVGGLGLYQGKVWGLTTSFKPGFSVGIGYDIVVSKKNKLFVETQYNKIFEADKGFIPIKIGFKFGL